jgi:predicted acyltransferase|tara:strand:- start:4104 stop:5222 length:1119 start_codon:yes stop_codon:yes gene_type:complete
VNQKRLLSVDALRGLAIAGMILVNTPGSWAFIYPPLKHAKWNGCTPTDVIFPLFLFIVGMSISLSMNKLKNGSISMSSVLPKIIPRTAIIFGLGLFLSAFPFDESFSNLRIMGVLQRIALCYCAGSFIYLFTSYKLRILFIPGILIAYSIALISFTFPDGFGNSLSMNENLVRYIDLFILGENHMYQVSGVPFDPEGLLSTFPAITTTLLGSLVGDFIISKRSLSEKRQVFFISGLIGIFAGLILNIWFPLNKQLWSSSFVLYSAGWGLVILSFFTWLVEERKNEKWVMPCIIIGSNPLFIFVASSLVVRIITRIEIQTVDSGTSLYTFIYTHLFASWAGNLNGSLLFAVSWILIWFGIAEVLYRKKIFIKI